MKLFACLLLWASLSTCASQPGGSRGLSGEASHPSLNSKSFGITSEGGHIALDGPDCATLIRGAVAVAAWQKNSPLVAEDCFCREGSCHVDISGLLPVWLKERLGETALKPNCFNTALVGAGLEREFHFTKFFEFSRILRERCEVATAPLAGDIGVVSRKGEGLSPVHAFLYFTPEFGFEKPGANLQDPWRFMNPGRIIGSASPYSYRDSSLVYYHCK